jgi:hypothetical protein
MAIKRQSSSIYGVNIMEAGKTRRYDAQAREETIAKQWEDGRTLPAVALQFDTEKARLVSENESAKGIPDKIERQSEKTWTC